MKYMILEFSILQCARLASIYSIMLFLLSNSASRLSGKTGRWLIQTISLNLKQIFKETTVTTFFKCGQWYFKVRWLGAQAGDLQFSSLVFSSPHIITKLGLLLCCSLVTINDKSFNSDTVKTNSSKCPALPMLMSN